MQLVPPVPQSESEFASLTWAQINMLAIVGDRTDYGQMIGWRKQFTVEGMGTFNARLVCFDRYDKTDGSGKSGFVFLTDEATNETYPINARTSKIGYPETTMHTETLPGILDRFPVDLAAVIAEVEVPCNNVVNANGGFSDSNFTVSETNASLFLPSRRELEGEKAHGYDGRSYYDYACTGADGVIFEYFKQNGNSNSLRVKRSLSGSTAKYWTRTATPPSGCWVAMDTVGCWAGQGAQYMEERRGLSLCFCVGKSN